MVVRFWSAQTTSAQSGKYLAHFRGAVLQHLRELQGFVSANVLTRDVNGATEIIVLTYWESLAAIDKFAAPDREAAVVTPQAAAVLTNYDRRVRHYEVAVSDVVANV